MRLDSWYELESELEKPIKKVELALQRSIRDVIISRIIPDEPHEFSFSAHQDAWKTRLGTSLEDLESRWGQLRDWPRDESFHPGDPRNTDPAVTAKERAEFQLFFQKYK